MLNVMREAMDKAAAFGEPGNQLPDMLASYHYDRNSFAPLYNAIREKIQKFDPENEFGAYLDGHLQRVRSDMESFMLALGYRENIAQKAGDAFALHDLGKILQAPALWQVTKEKQDRTTSEKIERPKHTALGLQALDEIVEEIGFVAKPDQAMHIGVAKFLMINHHERLDASGPYGMPGQNMDKILRIATIIDTVDGKLKTGKTYDEIFVDMLGAKHEGQFDGGLVAAYQTHINSGRKAAPTLAFRADS